MEISTWTRLKNWACRMKRESLALYLADRDARVPWYAKAMAMATAAYAYSLVMSILRGFPSSGCSVYPSPFITLSYPFHISQEAFYCF